MYVVTGGAGFIGSNIVKGLNALGVDDILIVDRLGTTDKWRNLADLKFHDYIHKDRFLDLVEAGAFDDRLDAIIHMGACSSTTERDADYLMQNNYEYSRRLAERFADKQRVRFIYASSAATYGDGSQGYSDDHSSTPGLRPLNMYGYSKQLFDLWGMRTGFLKRAVGIKYFNVFGPNEYHKADMRSVAIRAYVQAATSGCVKLFKSYRPDYKDGEQCRDFIYVKDAVKITLFFLDHPGANGLFNAGTSTPRNFNDLAIAVFEALNLPASIKYIDMPPGLEKRYQYYTAADTGKLRKAGYTDEFMSLEQAVREYVLEYLEKDRRWEVET